MASRTLLCVAGVVAGVTVVGADTPDRGLRGHGGPVRAVAALGDGGTLVTAGFDSAIIVWDIARGAARKVLRFHDGIVNALAPLPDGCFASAGEDTRIAVWCGHSASPVSVIKGHTGPISALVTAPHGEWLASASWDHSVRLWRTGARDAPPRVIEGHKGPVNAAAFSTDGRMLVTAGYSGEIRIDFLEPGRATLARRVSALPINSVVTTTDGRILTAGADGRILVLDAALETQFELALPDGPLTTLTVSPDGRLLATAGMRTPVTLIEREGLQVRTRILGPGLPIWSLTFSADGAELYSGGADRAVRRWRTDTGTPAGEDIAAPVVDSESKDTERGAHVFRACRACHGLTSTDTNRAGPTLAGIIGRRIATQPGYVYSAALEGMDIVWTQETISRLFEIGPNAMTPGTKMPEQRLTDPEDRKALVQWLDKVTR